MSFLFSISKEKRLTVIKFLGIKIKLSRKEKQQRAIVTDHDKEAYIDYVLNQQLDKSAFVKDNLSSPYNGCNKVKPIAFYLPQYHDFAENIKWFGRGFSEWSNTSKAVPQYVGHWQPHIPIDVGYYNLDNINVMKRQIELAKQYGIYGFCFYYYWFSGTKIMEKPLQKFLADTSLDMPFFLFWANEDWSMLWDNGKEKEILYKQELVDGDAEKFMHDILPFMKDSRYIKINNRPLLILYHPQKYPPNTLKNFINKIQNMARTEGFDGLYLMTIARGPRSEYADLLSTYGFEAMVEFFPAGLNKMLDQKSEKIVNSQFKGLCYDIAKFIREKSYLYDTPAKIFKGCFPSWDNTARKCYNGAQICQNTPQNYKTWLKDIICWTKEHHPDNEQYLFINAWNEWAEGAHLEPDQKYGYAYLQATKEALEETSK